MPTILVGAYAVALGLFLGLSSLVRNHWSIIVIASLACAGFAAVLPQSEDVQATTSDVPAAPQATLRAAEAIAAVQTATVPSARASSTVALTVEGFSWPKTSATAEENEDGWAAAAERGVAVAADGASSSYRSGEWAGFLTSFLAHNLGRSTTTTPDALVLEAARSFRGGSAVASPVSNQAQSWWSEAVDAQGSHCAFATLTVESREGALSWNCFAVGDVTLIHLRRNGAALVPLCSFPMDTSQAFGGHPALVTSLAATRDDLPSVRSATGAARATDVWLLMTDALAQWSLTQDERSQPAWELLASGSQSDIRHAVDQARAMRTIVDDDITLVRASLPN